MNAKYCFINKTRICYSECMAFDNFNGCVFVCEITRISKSLNNISKSLNNISNELDLINSNIKKVND